MLVVADSSPLNVLVRIGLVDVLPKLFQTVAIPPQVAEELSHPHTPPDVKKFIASPPSWLQIRSPKSIDPIPAVDRGEEAAINLVRELNAALLLIDDIDGRRAAAQRGIPLIGTLGVLQRAGLRNFLDFREALTRIRKTDFRISDDLLVRAIADYEARKQTRS